MMNQVKTALLGMQRHNWEQGVAAQAFLEAGDHDVAIAMAVEGANRQQADGRCCQIDDSTAVTDPCAIGEALIFACEKTGDPFLCAARDALLRWALREAPRTPDGTVHHFTHDALIWVDSMYMLPPFLARAGYFDEALAQLDGYWDILFNPANKLLSHQWSDREKLFHRKDAWAVGNGWAMAGMARVIALLPDSHAEDRQRLIGRVRTLIDAALPFQLEDGAFHDVLDDPSAFREVNFSQMLAYTIYRGVAAGWLDAAYLPAAEKARAAALQEVDAFGLVRNVCGMPYFDSPGVAPEGQAFHILMEAARKDLHRA
ncbi:MAG: glycosyl hydrolase [Clostridiales bacterium]|nr:glycosyl hydrolase [Clostridiales bacterium]